MGQIINNKPVGGLITDNKPSQGEINAALSNKLITRGYDALMPMGLLLAITYSAGGTFTTEYNP
jgi:hypothetical protein